MTTKKLELVAVYGSEEGVRCAFAVKWLKQEPLAHAEMSADEALYLAAQLIEAVRKTKKGQLS